MFRFRDLYKALGFLSVGAVSGAGIGIICYSEHPSRAATSALETANQREVSEGTRHKLYPEPVRAYSPLWDSNWDYKNKSVVLNETANTDVYTSGTKDRDLKDNPMLQNLQEKESPSVKKAKASRHLFLIRHGQYHSKEDTDKGKRLTELGRMQALKTGERLKTLNIKFDKIIHSNMTRAIETADLVSQSLPQIPKSTCTMLREGAPCKPEPPSSTKWRPEDWEFYQEGSRIEAAFRKYFHRADASQEKDSYELIVCHANVIRYFACRALQFPPNGWLRMSIGHCGITWITIRPNGRVSLKSLGDTGHLPPELLTFS